MPGVEHMNLRFGQITVVTLRLPDVEACVVLTPNDQRGRATRAEELLEARAQFDVGPVVREPVELHLHVTGAAHQRPIEGPRVRSEEQDPFSGNSGGVLLACALGVQPVGQPLPVRLRRLTPVRLRRAPLRSQAPLRKRCRPGRSGPLLDPGGAARGEAHDSISGGDRSRSQAQAGGDGMMLRHTNGER